MELLYVEAEMWLVIDSDINDPDPGRFLIETFNPGFDGLTEIVWNIGMY